ncbi:DNA-binding IclR family transcriptional regulator [Streptomyces sp. SAI-195]
MHQRAQGETTVALQHQPTAPHHSAQDALRVLETVARHTSGVTDTEIGRESGLDRERLTTLLRMLRREGYVEQTADGVYVTGEALARLGSAHGREQALREKLQRTLDRLRDSVGAAVYISRYVDGEVSVTQYADSPATPRVNEWVDFRVSAHATAVGKSLLTQLDHAGRRDHLSRHRMGPPDLAHHHQRQAAAVPAGVPAGHRARPRPPGVRGGHGLRGRADHRRVRRGLPGPVAPGRARAPAAPGRGRAEPERGTGAAVPGDLGSVRRPVRDWSRARPGTG